MLSMPLQAALIGYDGFIYPLGAALPGQNGGEGFAGSWLEGVNAGVPASRFQVFTPSLSYPGLASDGVRLRVTAGAVQGARRLLAQPLGTEGTVRYVSLLVRPDAAPSASTYFGLQLLGSAGGDLFAGKPGGGATQRYVLENAGGAGQIATTRNVTVNEVALLVLRLEFNAGNDRISLYVNPVLGAAEPATADAVKTDLDLGTTVVLALTGPAAWSVDELRVGDTYASVTPPAPDFQLRPIFSGSATEHILVTQQVGTVDPLPPGRTLTFSLVGETYGAQIDPVSGLFTWVPGELEGGQRRTFNVRATSNATPPASVTTSFFLDVAEGNLPPQLAEIPDQSVTEGSEFTYQLVATDADIPAQNITYSLSVRPEGLTVSSAGVLTWRPNLAQAGRSHPVTVFAIDTMAGRAERSFTVTVQPRTRFSAKWRGGPIGDWNVPANWDVGRVPNNTVNDLFDVVLDGQQPATIRIPGAVTIHDLFWTAGGSIEIQSASDVFAVEGSLFWAGGAVAGPGRMTVHGRATMHGGQGGPLVLRDQCRLALKSFSELESPLRCDGDVSVVVEPAATLGVTEGGGFLRLGGIPELRNEGIIRIWGSSRAMPFIFLRNRGTVTIFSSTINFETGAPTDLIQESGGSLDLGAGLDHGATLNGNAIFHNGSTVLGEAFIREARVEGRIQGRLNFDRLSFGSTAISKFSLIRSRDRLSATQPIALAGQLELAPLQGIIPGPDDVFEIVSSPGEITGQFAGRPFGQRVLIPGRSETMLLTRSAGLHRVELRSFLPGATGLSTVPLDFRLPEGAGGLGGCFVLPHPAVILPEGIVAGGTLTVEITENYNAAVDRLEFRGNPTFPEADEIVFEGPVGGAQTVRFRGTIFGTVQLTSGLMTCVLNEQADSEAAVALLGRLYYGNTELTPDWFTQPGQQYPPRTIVVTLTDALGANEVSRFVNFPFLWGIRLPESLLLPNGQEAILHLQGWFSSQQVLPVRKMVTTWSDAGCGVLNGTVAGFPGQQPIVGKPPAYCCTVTATAGFLYASTQIYEGITVERDFEEPLLRIVLGWFDLDGTLDGLPPDCPFFWEFAHVYVIPECATTPRFQAAGGGQTPLPSPTPIYALENLMKKTAAGQRWVNLYRQHGPEVVRLFVQHPSLLLQAQELVAAYQPGVVALLAGRGDTVPIYAPMITLVNNFWNALAEHASPALKTALEQEQARFDNFRLFENGTFNHWAGLLGISVPFQPHIHISLMRREATQFRLALNDVPGVNLSLWRSLDLQTWTPVTNAEMQRDGSTLLFTDPAPPAGHAFYNVRQ